MPKRRIYSIGHSTHQLARFVQLLRAHGVTQLADVRAHPGSRRLPWFNGELLSQELPSHELAYAHLPELGGRRRPARDSRNDGWKIEGFRGYADHMASTAFATGLAALEALATRGATAMMCAEGLWWRCHRRLISDALTVREWEVVHIGPNGEPTQHRLTPFAVCAAGGLSYPAAQTSLDSS